MVMVRMVAAGLVLTGALIVSSCISDKPESTTPANSLAESATKKQSSNQGSPEASDDEDTKGVLMVERQNPKSIQIMRDNCRGRYKVLPDREAKRPQIEVGISRPIGGDSNEKPAAPSPYIRYRCED